MATNKMKVIFILACIGFVFPVFSQNDSIPITHQEFKDVQFYNYRGLNTIDAAIGTSVINGDLPNPMFEIFTHIGYKRFIIPYVNVNFSYNKFNLAFEDIYNEGFMSFDLNVEGLLFPHEKFSPFAFVGGGYNAANYFEQTASKIQGGLGIEYILTEGIGIKLYGDYNYVFSDELDGIIAGASDDAYYRIGLGVNYYFGGEKKKKEILDRQPSIIKSNSILDQ